MPVSLLTWRQNFLLFLISPTTQLRRASTSLLFLQGSRIITLKFFQRTGNLLQPSYNGSKSDEISCLVSLNNISESSIFDKPCIMVDTTMMGATTVKTAQSKTLISSTLLDPILRMFQTELSNIHNFLITQVRKGSTSLLFLRGSQDNHLKIQSENRQSLTTQLPWPKVRWDILSRVTTFLNPPYLSSHVSWWLLL